MERRANAHRRYRIRVCRFQLSWSGLFQPHACDGIIFDVPGLVHCQVRRESELLIASIYRHPHYQQQQPFKELLNNYPYIKNYKTADNDLENNVVK